MANICLGSALKASKPDSLSFLESFTSAAAAPFGLAAGGAELESERSASNLLEASTGAVAGFSIDLVLIDVSGAGIADSCERRAIKFWSPGVAASCCGGSGVGDINP